MRVLDLKLFRDVKRLWAQALAIALVIAGGVATLVLAVGSFRSLDETRNAYYERYRFADVFASVRRAPNTLLDRIAEIPGVVRVNTADDLTRGLVFLTVTGTSAECGDDGQTGRGNRANGLITPFRPMTMEAVAGKNPISHVGKLDNTAANRLAAASSPMWAR